MALGKPGIPPIASLELRLVSQAMDAVRQRLESIEKDLGGRPSAAQPQGSGASAAVLAELGSLRRDLNALAAVVQGLASGGSGQQPASEAVITVVADGEVPEFCAVLATGQNVVGVADPNDPGRVHGVFGVSVSWATDGGEVRVRRWGQMEVEGAAFEIGRAVYAAPGGGLTQDPSAYGAVALPVGVAADTELLWVAPGGPILLSELFEDYGRERWLPVSFEVVAEALQVVQALRAAGPGLIVQTGDGVFAARRLVPGDGIRIEQQDGVAGDPVISVWPAFAPGAAVLALTGHAPIVTVTPP